MRIQAESLAGLATRIFGRMGSPRDEAALVADSLVTANLLGHDSHGVGLVPSYVAHFEAGHLHPGTSVRTVSDDGALMAFDGRHGFGRRVGGEAMASAAARCRETGVALMTLRNAHHLGRIGAYGEIAMEAGLVSLHFVNVTAHEPCVAPWGGSEARFVTNPVCIAVPPTGRTPATLLDMATSRIAMGKARVAMTGGVPLDEGLVIDAAGRGTTDPSVIFSEPRGALLPFGMHKGSGLALMCELLAGGLSGGGTIQPGNPRTGSIVNNMLAILVDPARLVDMDWLRAEIDATVAYVKSARPADPGTPVVVAGDPERASRERRAAEGVVLDDTAWTGLLEAGERLGLDRHEMESAA